MKSEKIKRLGMILSIVALVSLVFLITSWPQTARGADLKPNTALQQVGTLIETPVPPVIESGFPFGSSTGTCSNPLAISCGDQVNDSNTGYNSDHDSYNCNGWDESGPEAIYQFTLPAGNVYTVTAKLSNLGAIDLDVYLLDAGGCDSNTCLGTTTIDDIATATNVSPGTYYIAVDGYAGAVGSYTLDLDCTPTGPVNQPPNTPSNPSPADKATGVSRTPTLTFTGGDPDGDTVLYTVYGQEFSSVISDVWCAASTSTSCQPNFQLKANTKYAWFVHADDQKGGVTDGPFWEFTTVGSSDGKLFLPMILNNFAGAVPSPSPSPSPTVSPSASPSPSATVSPPPQPTTPAPPVTVTPDPSTPTQPADLTFTRFINNSSYPIVSMVVDSVEEFPASPLGLLPGYYYDMPLAAGQHHVLAYNGYWESDGTRSTFYMWEGDFIQTLGLREDVTFDDPTIEQYMTNFKPGPTDGTYWEGEYWTGFPVEMHTAGFCFYNNSKFRFYIDQVQDDTGTYALLGRQPDVFTITFRVTNTAGSQYFDGTYYETEGFFFMKNGPSDWQTIQYYRDDNIVCDPAP